MEQNVNTEAQHDNVALLREALVALQHHEAQTRPIELTSNVIFAIQEHLSAPAQTSQAKTPASGEAVKRWSVNLDGYVVADPQGAWVRYADITPPASQEQAQPSGNN